MWSSRLPEFVQDDFPVAKHITVIAAAPVDLSCTRCAAEQVGLSSHLIGSFLDDHNHCGESLTELWRCSGCSASEFRERRNCRICETPRGDTFFQGSTIAPTELRERFEIHRPGYGVAARIEANSLREVLRAAKSMFAFEDVTIHLGERTWKADHAAK
jgi:hypothetical protein